MNEDSFGLVAALLGLGFFAYLGIRYLRRRHAGQKWPIASGAVSSTDLKQEDRGEQNMHVATVRYSYRVADETFSGKHSRDFLLHGRAEKWLRQYPDGAALRIRYNFENVSESMLFEKDQTHAADSRS